jgi:class 3 adenylate cyclase
LSETRKIAATLAADVVGYTWLAGADDDRTLARLPALHGDLIDPTIATRHGRPVKRTAALTLPNGRTPHLQRQTRARDRQLFPDVSRHSVDGLAARV